MLSVILGVSGALVYGVSDFFGGMGSRHLGALRLTWLSVIAGLITIFVTFQLADGIWSAITWQSMMWGGLSGICGSFAIMFLYASLAIGPMSIVSPLGAVIAAIVPVIWDIINGRLLGPVAYVAIVVALVAVVMVGFVKSEGALKLNPRGILFAALAGIGIGGYLICMSQTPANSGFEPFLANRVVAFTVLTIAMLITWMIKLARSRGIGHDGEPRADVVVGERGEVNWKYGLIFAVLCGVLDTGANVIILEGIRFGSLSVMGVLASLYPAGTIALAAIVLKERIALIQWIGMVLALAAIAMLSLA
ncbi:MAG: hypothetical protein RLZZ600_414 [Actinomycetota bacterium]|jgi:uncharacterized membrane protein